ncbi:MAG TPA: PPK2 family polyphosphate kinase [Cellulomonas sp.]
MAKQTTKQTTKHAGPWDFDASDALRVRHGFSLADLDTSATPGFKDGEKASAKLLAEIGLAASGLQERLYAHGRSGGTRSVLLVVQGLDTAGKGGIMRHVAGMLDPQGLALHAFGVPSPEERKHHYLWRVRNALPEPGRVGVFDRSHYEDVLVVRVDNLVPRDVWEQRYDEINAFEDEIATGGTTVVKVALMVSRDEQYARLHQRLERPDKYWKFDPNDVDTRAKWPDYLQAYQTVLDRTSTDIAPWHVIPADKKWYSRLAVSQLLWQALAGLDLDWPPAGFDVAAQLARLEATK